MKTQKFMHRITEKVKTKAGWLKELEPIVRDFNRLGYHEWPTTEAYFNEKINEGTLIPVEA